MPGVLDLPRFRRCSYIILVRPLLALLLLCAGLARAETIQLRKNGNVVSFEYLTQDEDTITVQLPGKDTVLTYKWEDLDQDWVKKNQPKLWAERQLLTKPEEAPDKKMEKEKEAESDPFAKELPPADLKTLVKNLAAAMTDGLKGLPMASVEPLCKEADIDESAFWKAYDDLKKAGRVVGAAKPADIPDRTSGVTVRDSHATALGHALRDALRTRFGQAPQLVVCELSRKKVDCNREIAEGAAGQPKAEQVWREYHAIIDEAESAVLARSKHGLYLDIHSHGHPKPRIEIGYLLKGSELRLTDERLDNDTSVAARSSIRWLSQRTPAKFSELLRGETSLGGLFAARGVPSVPSPREVLLLDDPYFNGAYDIAAHGSRDKSQLDAAQLEVPGPMRDTPAHRAATAAAIAESLDVYFARHFGMKLK